MILALKLDLWMRVGTVASAWIYTGAPVAFVLHSVHLGLNKQHFLLCISGRMCETFSLNSVKCLRLPPSAAKHVAGRNRSHLHMQKAAC